MDSTDRESIAVERAKHDQDEAEALDAARTTAKVIATFRRELVEGGIDVYLADELTREYTLTVLGRDDEGDD